MLRREAAPLAFSLEKRIRAPSGENPMTWSNAPTPVSFVTVPLATSTRRSSVAGPMFVIASPVEAAKAIRSLVGDHTGFWTPPGTNTRAWEPSAAATTSSPPHLSR